MREVSPVALFPAAIELTDVVLTSVSVSGSSGTPVETVCECRNSIYDRLGYEVRLDGFSRRGTVDRERR